MFEVFDKMTHQYNRTSYEQLKDFIYREQEGMFDRADEQRAQVQTHGNYVAMVVLSDEFTIPEDVFSLVK